MTQLGHRKKGKHDEFPSSKKKSALLIEKDTNGEDILDREVIGQKLAEHYQQRVEGSNTNWNQVQKYIKKTQLKKRWFQGGKLIKDSDVDIMK